MKALPLLIASTFGRSQDVENLNVIHKVLNYDKELFEVLKSSAKIGVPVDLTVFEAYYRKFNFYKYLDEYTFEDKIFIFDAKATFDPYNNPYQESSAWLSNLRRTNKLSYFIYGNYSNKHHIQEKDHINWIDGNSDAGSKLRNILKLDLSNVREAFEPYHKKISFDHNWQVYGRINLYSSYFVKNSRGDLRNQYSTIKYGKHKYQPETAKSLFNSWVGGSTCEDFRRKSDSNLRVGEVNYDGYDGICNGINFWGGSNVDFTKSYSKKWATPYAAYKRTTPKYWQDEYYYYSLGGYENNRGFGSNLNQSYNHRTIWKVNYDDIFVIANNKDQTDGYSKLQLGLNFKKIKNLTNFLKVSHLFDFTLNLSVNGMPRAFKFNLQELIEKNNVFDLNLSNKYIAPLFSDLSLTISKREHANAKYVQLFNKGEGFKYTVDISQLSKNEQIFGSIEFSNAGLDKHYASEMLDKDKLRKQFFITNGKDKKVIIPDELFEKLNVRVDFDDVRGVLNVKYHDFLRDLDSEGYANNMKIIPNPKDYNISSLSNAKELLKRKYSEDTNDHFWNSIDFVANGSGYDIVVNQKNQEVKEQWEEFFRGKKASFSSRGDLSLIPMHSNYNPLINYDSESITSLFELNSSAIDLGLTKKDYKFYVNRKNNNETEVRVVFNQEEKLYLFKGREKANLDLVHASDLIPVDDSEDGMFKYSMIVICGVLATSVSSLGMLEVLKVLNRRKTI